MCNSTHHPTISKGKGSKISNNNGNLTNQKFIQNDIPKCFVIMNAHSKESSLENHKLNLYNREYNTTH